MTSESENVIKEHGKEIQVDLEIIARLESSIVTPELQNAYSSFLASNPDKIEGSVGEYLIALRPGMSLSDAEEEQRVLAQNKPIDCSESLETMEILYQRRQRIQERTG